MPPSMADHLPRNAPHQHAPHQHAPYQHASYQHATARPRLAQKEIELTASMPVHPAPLHHTAQRHSAQHHTTQHHTTQGQTALGQTALAKPQPGLWGAIGNWLTSARRLFVVKRHRHPAARADSRIRAAEISRHTPQPTLRERTELIQLRAENRRLRQQIERMAPTPPLQPAAALPSAPDSPSITAAHTAMRRSASAEQ